MVAVATEREWVSVSQAARRLDVSGNTVRKWLRLGLLKLHSKTPGGNCRIDISSIDALKARMEAAGA